MKQLKIYVLREVYTLLKFEESKYDQNLNKFLENLCDAGFYNDHDLRWLKLFFISLWDCECILFDKMTYQEAQKAISDKISSLI